LRGLAALLRLFGIPLQAAMKGKHVLSEKPLGRAQWGT